LGEVESLDEALREVGEGGGGFAVDVALGDGDEQAAEGVVEIAGGDVGAGEVGADVLADVIGGEGLRFFASVEGAEVGVARAARHAAAVAVGEGESARVAFRLGRNRAANFICAQVRACRSRMRGHMTLRRSGGHRSLLK